MFCFNKGTKSRKSSNRSSRESDLDNQTSNSCPKASIGTNHSISNQHHVGKSNPTNHSGANNENLHSTTTNQPNVAARQNENGDMTPAINNPYRYVTAEYHAQADDELSVMPGDLVLVEDTVTSADIEWSHVFCFFTNKRGFVRSDILTADVRRNPARKKKISHPANDTCCQHHHHQHHYHAHPSQLAHQHRHQGHQNGKVPQFGIQASPQSGDSIRLHPMPSFKLQHSLEGSSAGQHSFPNLNAPAYYNLGSATSPMCEQDFSVFSREMLGTYVVIYNFVAREENDLSVKPGDFVSVLNKDDPDWYWVRSECDHSEGFVPARFMCDYKQVKSFLDKGNSTMTMKSSNDHDLHIYINQTNGIGPPHHNG